jgi:LPS sulfotransferase NodH
VTTPDRGYAICTVPRSGSNFLGQVLASTGRLGRPLEYFNGPARRELDTPGYPDDPQQQLIALLQHGATPNGVYGFKMFPTQLDVVGSAVRHWSEALPRLGYVHLERRDLLGQAVSWVRAEQTRQYRSTSSAMREPSYDAAAITDRLRVVAILQSRWRLFFAVNAITPLSLWYEDVVAAPQVAADRVAKHVGLDAPVVVDEHKVELQRQADGISEAWRIRYLADHGRRPTAPHVLTGRLGPRLWSRIGRG